MKQIKTFEDACKALGLAIPEGLPEMLKPQYEAIIPARYIAQMKLEIITAALNGGWEYRPEPDVWCYWPWFEFFTKNEMDDMGPEKEKERNVVPVLPGQANGFSGLAFSLSYYAWSNASSFYGARLAYKTAALAEHSGKQFAELWRDYLFG